MALGVMFLAAGALAMLAGVAFGPRHAAAVVGPMMLYLCGVGLVLPQAIASAMQPFPDRAGAASSLLGTIQMSFAALVGILAGALIDASPLPLPALMTATGLGALVLFHASAGPRRIGG
jgi:DHA1 family bicyclomycin/chloramphenicol resistance-like MFS transporter